MIQAILTWSVDSWHIVEARIALLTLSRVDGPVSALDLSARHFFAVVEGILREAEHHSQQLDELYAAAIPQPQAQPDRSSRRAEIDRLSRLFGG